ncbi:sensor histidine kinase [Nonomuraea salmonea]|uniref:histidine kinase n=1 Tax=Nonomuraea salmonea TaxID=46181 RepID=A0ABV5P000_9ACTN
MEWLGVALFYLFASAPLLLLVLVLISGSLGRPVADVGILLTDMATGAVGIALLPLRRRWPWQVATVLAAASAFSFAANGPAIAAFTSLATHRRWRQVVPVGVVFWVCVAISTRWKGDWRLTAVYAVVSGTILAGLTVFGLYLRGRRELEAERRAAELRGQAQRVEQAKLAERLKIAQEMHDVLAHRISLLAMLAGGLAYRKDLTPEQTRETALAIQENAHHSLTELRAVLGTLRRGDLAGQDGPADQDRPAGQGGTAEGGPAPPQPTLAHLGALFAEVRAAGQQVEVDDSVTDRELLPAQTGRHAYRIVQEALTNARKHAPGSVVRAEIGGRPGDGLRIRVSNAAVPGRSGPGGRLGLVGLAERTRMAGGRITHDVRDGRFVLDATLPWEA